MKKINLQSAAVCISCLLLTANCQLAFGQNIAINTNNTIARDCAILDVRNTTSTLGMLIPNFSITLLTTFGLTGTAVDGVIIYNTNTAVGNGSGYYYWSTTAGSWINLLDNYNPGGAWLTLGNTGLSAATNFVGTINGIDLVFRTTNVERARILAAGNVGINVAPSASYQLLVSSALTSIYGASTGAATYGVLGTSTSATGFGVDGFNSAAAGTGVIGSGNNIAGSYLAGGGGGAFTSTNVGVSGFGNNTAASWGVYGTSANATGDGLVGANSVAAGGGSGTGMWGVSSQNGGATSMAAIEGYNNNATGTGMAAGGNNLGIVTLVNGGGGSFNGLTIGLWGRTTQAGVTQNAGVYATCSNFGRSTYLSLYNGTYYKTLATGVAINSCAVPDLNEKMVCMHAPETPEAYFQDFGQGQLVNGKVHIDLDPIFAKNVTINEKHPLRVFIQLEENENCKGVVVKNKSTTSFDVVELNGGISNTPFQWFVTCNMADSKGENGLISKFADLRFEPAPIPMEEKNTTTIKAKERKNIDVITTTTK